MITIAEVLKLSLFSKFNILCGKQFLNNSVTSPVILEYESSRINYEGYGPGYFVLLSYFFVYKDPDLVNNTIITLLNKKVSGIAIKLQPTDTIPDEILQLAERNHVPILTFYEEFIEDLIISINESMKTRTKYIILEEKINTFLNQKASRKEVQSFALEINPDFNPYIYVAHLTSKAPIDNLSIHRYFDRLMYRTYRTKKQYPYSLIKYKLGILLICSYTENSLLPDKTSVETSIRDIAIDSGFALEDFYIGVADEPMPLSKLDISIQQAIDSNSICKFENNTMRCYSTLGIYKYILTLLKNETLYQEIEHDISILVNYDEVHDSSLLETLKAYVKNTGDYKNTSAELFQHTNTIRYRIKKAEQMLGLTNDHNYEEIAILIQCYLLHESLTT